MTNIAFRVDASASIGSGHLMRCLALGNRLRDRGSRARFLCRQLPEHLKTQVHNQGHEVVDIGGAPGAHYNQDDDARDSRRALSGEQWDWLVVDHYRLDAAWESMVRPAVRRVMAIDDLANRTHDCDALLDQNLFEEPAERYAGRVPESCTLLLGPRFALLREEFGCLRSSVGARSGAVKRILVSLGGVDQFGHTGRAVEALARLRFDAIDVDVVIGKQHPYRNDVEAACRRLGFTCHVDSARMAELMAAADLCIGATGSTTWERCCLGLPTLALCTAENQRQVREQAALAGLVYAPALGADADLTIHLQALLDNPELLRAMSRRAYETVDGRGTSRVARAMGISSVSLREATRADSAKMLSWRNHPEARRFSRNAAEIDPAAHERWLSAVFADADKALLIGQAQGVDVGVVRFDIRGGEAEVSIYMAPGASRAGNGVELLLAAEAWLANHRRLVRTLTAEVLGDNLRSLGLFESGGYARRSAVYTKELQEA